MFHFTFARHPVPVRSLLNGRLSPDNNVVHKNGGVSKMPLGSGFQTGLVAWQLIERALHYQTRTVRAQALSNRWEEVKLTLFHCMRSDVALRSRVDGEYAGIRAAFRVSIHSASASIDGSLEDSSFPTVQEPGVEAVPCSVAVGEHERLFGVQSVLCEGVKLSGIPVNLDLDFGKSHRVCRICTFSVGCEGNVGLVVIRIKVLRGFESVGVKGTSQGYRTFPSQQLGNVCRT